MSMAATGILESVVRVGKGKKLPLPAWVIHGFGKSSGGYVRIRRTRAGVLLKPAGPGPKTQGWFWTREWQRAEREVDREIAAGRIRRSGNLKELLRALRS